MLVWPLCYFQCREVHSVLSTLALPCLASLAGQGKYSSSSPQGQKPPSRRGHCTGPLGSGRRLLFVQALVTRFERGKEEQEGRSINHVKHMRPLRHLYYFFCDAACITGVGEAGLLEVSHLSSVDCLPALVYTECLSSLFLSE